MTFDPASVSTFRYRGVTLDAARGTVHCRYALDDVLEFTEEITVDAPPQAWSQPAVAEAARLVFLLAGVSYYKAAAPPRIDLGDTRLRPGEREFLTRFYVDGLGEYAYTNGLDLRDITIVGGRPAGAPPAADARPGRPLIPFGGGIDSIVTVESVRERYAEAALFVMSRNGVHFEAIEDAAAVTGLPVLRANQNLDPRILRSAALGFRNGHVPVTGVLSAVAVLAAVLDGRDAVVMSNEWSASIGNVEIDGRSINHQYSKSWAFESGFRDVLAGAFAAPPSYFSYLRSRSELWIAERFRHAERYHRVFRSCNRAFHIDPSQRWDQWCGRCDKCAFIDLVLAPFMSPAALEDVFGGPEPLRQPDLLPTFRALLGLSADAKPFECVGDVDECRTAAVLAARRGDRRDTPLLQTLLTELGPTGVVAASSAAQRLSAPLGPDHVPHAYAPRDSLV